MADKFWSLDDAMSKMYDSICLYKGVPYRVSFDIDEIAEDYVNLYSLCKPGDVQKVKYTSDDFDYGSPELGWFKSPNRTIYLCRKPGRFNNVGLFRINLDESLTRDEFYSKHLYNCIMGIHSTFEDAQTLVWSDGVVPFGRHIALVRNDSFNASIVYINRIIGRIDTFGRIYPVMSSRKDTAKILKHLGVPL